MPAPTAQGPGQRRAESESRERGLAEQGGTIDDLYVYRLEPESFLLVINASRIEADVAWLRHLFGPVDLDLVLDDNVNPDGLPDANRTFTIRGVIGDNPDNGINTFHARPIN